MRERDWHQRLLELHALITPLYLERGLPIPDCQDLQHQLCEFHKFWDIKTGRRQRLKREYRPNGAMAPKKAKAPAERKPRQQEIVAGEIAPAPIAPEPMAAGLAVMAAAEAIEAAKAEAEPPPETTAPEPETKASEPPPRSKRNGYPHGERCTGAQVDFYIYLDARGRYYLGVERTSTKQFPQFHWNGTQWVKGLPKGFLKIPYRLPELLDAPPEQWIVIAAGEKDADTAARLGFVATTNSGGEGPEQWTPELNRWFTGKQRVAVMEDNDDTGRAHAIEVARALSGIVPDIRIVTFRELPVHGDLTDWTNAGHDQAALKARIEAAPAATNELEEWDAGELLSGALPEPRQWLTQGQFCRTFLSGLVAPGDVGKTTLRLTQAIELASGRELLGLHVYGRRRVLVISFEDDHTELHRRLLAICKHHSIDPAELKGWLFCRDLNGGAKLAELDACGRRRQIGRLDGMLRRAIARTGCSLVVLDPFVKLHALNESDNPDMDFVCSLLIKIAQDCNIGVDSPAHTHKGQIQAGDADARRGASAQRDAGRLDYTLTVMSEGEAEQFGIPADERKRFMRLDKAKANIVRAVKARWFRLVSVPLGNADSVYVDGDEVQAIERWEPPETWAGTEPEALNAILDELARGLPDGRRYSDHSKAKGRVAWQVVQKHCPGKPEAQCREMIRQWIKAGVLVENDYDDPTARKPRKGLFLDPGKRPHY